MNSGKKFHEMQREKIESLKIKRDLLRKDKLAKIKNPDCDTLDIRRVSNKLDSARRQLKHAQVELVRINQGTFFD